MNSIKHLLHLGNISVKVIPTDTHHVFAISLSFNETKGKKFSSIPPQSLLVL